MDSVGEHLHICYIFLRDILIFILDPGPNGSLPEGYLRAIAADTALSEDVVPPYSLYLGGIFPRDADYLIGIAFAIFPGTSADGALPTSLGPDKLPRMVLLLVTSLQGLSFPRTWAVLGLMGLSPCSWSSRPL